MVDSNGSIRIDGVDVGENAPDSLDSSSPLLDDTNDLHMIDLCKDIMIHERDKNSAYTRVLSDQIVFLKSELSRKQSTIEALLKLLMQKDQSPSDDGDTTAAKIQDIIKNDQENKDFYGNYLKKNDKAGKDPAYNSNPFHTGFSKHKDPSDARMEYIESIGSSVLKQSRDVELFPKKQGLRYGYKLITADIGEF